MCKSSPNYIYYLNALFDFNLGGYTTVKLTRFASEMSTLFAFMGGKNDKVLLDIELPDDFLSYLNSIGIELLKPFDKKQAEGPHLISVPWGWDNHSYNRLMETGAICDIPDLETVKKVNSRQFHNFISDECNLGVPGSVYCGTLDLFQQYIKMIENPVVVKPSFGGSGFGFRIIQNREQGESICKDIENLMQHGGVTVEPWCRRVYDFSSSITISKDGKISSIRHQRSFSNAHGSFIGIYMAPFDPVIEKYAPVQEMAVKKAAEKLYSHGYFGPAGFDSFSYIDKNGNEKIAPVIEINARHSMSDVAHAIRNKYAPDKWCFFRMMSHRRSNLPDTYQKWIQLIKEDHFNPSTQEGVILTTPLLVKQGNVLVQPAKNGFFIAANSENELFEKDERLRRRVEKKK